MPALDASTLDQLAAANPSQAARRREAFDVYSSLATPTESEEGWRYVNVPVDLDAIELAVAPGQPIAPGAFLSAMPERAAEATVVDGYVTSLVSGAGVTLTRWSERAPEDPVVPSDRDKFAAARAAFGTDGLVIEVAPDAAPGKPIVLDLQATSATASFPTISVRGGSNSEASVVLVYRSPEGVRSVISPLLDLRAADGARLRFLTVQDLGLATTSVVHQRVGIGRDASVKVGEVGLGGLFARLDLGVLLEGAGGSAEVVGLSFGEHDQTLDYRMVINHRGKSTSSNVFLKGAVEDQAQSVFVGLLRIEEGAVRSSAFETNRNLVLSEGAKAHSVPNLEILCDDVVCGHGSSVGPLAEEPLYYLQSRGLPRERAERLLIKGFFQEAIERLPVSGLEKPLQTAVFQRFVAAQEEGRVA